MEFWVNEPILILLGIGWVAAIFFGLKMYGERQAWKNLCPEGLVIREGRETGKPVVCLHDEGSGKSRYILGRKKGKAAYEFDIADYNVKITPEFSSHNEPDLLGGDLRIYHYGTNGVEAIGKRTAMALCNMETLRGKEEYINLRFLRPQDLHGLVITPAVNRRHDCMMYLKEYAKKDVGQPMPATVDEFVTLIEEFVADFSEFGLYEEPEYFGVTYESVRKKTPIVQKVKKGLFSRTSTSPPKDEFETSTEPVYELAYRKLIVLKQFSYKFAVNAIGYGTLAKDVNQMLLLAEQRGRESAKEDQEKLLKYGVTALLILIGGGVAFIMITNAGGAV